MNNINDGIANDIEAICMKEHNTVFINRENDQRGVKNESRSSANMLATANLCNVFFLNIMAVEETKTRVIVGDVRVEKSIRLVHLTTF